MLDRIAKIKRFLWECIELGFAGLLAIMLVYLILGASSGSFVQSVAANVIAFVNAVPAGALIGFAIVAMLVVIFFRRRTSRDPAGR